MTTLDNVAFEISPDENESERTRLQGMGLAFVAKTWSGEYAWLRARSFFFDDPEGSTIEWIAYHPGRQ